MSTYRPNYHGYPRSYHDIPPPPPPLHLIPPLPHGPPPEYDSYRPPRRDSWRPANGPLRHNEFTFQNDNSAPQYPREQDHLKSTRAMEYGRHYNTRTRPNPQNRDGMNLHRARRGSHPHYGRGSRAAPFERALLTHRDHEGGSSEQVLGMSNGQKGANKFMAAEDISDSDEEQMDESDVQVAGFGHVDASDEQTKEGTLEPPTKRRMLTASSRDAEDGASQPRWSNPDPYTVLPPLDDSQRKKKDVVKLIRKARKEGEAAAAERNQVAANDDFISFGMEDDSSLIVEEGVGVPGAPTGPRQFSHFENLHDQDAPGTSGKTISADSLGPPPDLAQPPSSLPEETVISTVPCAIGASSRAETITIDVDRNDALGSRKRTHDDQIKNGMDYSTNRARKGNKGRLSGSIDEAWIPGEAIDPVPWVRRTDMVTANAGFRLHKEICDFYEFVRPQEFEQTIREELLSRLQSVVIKDIPHAEVHCFGSFAAGLYLPTADMDVVIMSHSFRSYGQKVVCQVKHQMFRLGKFLEKSGLARRGSVEVISAAKVPIIKLIDHVTGIKIDMSFENDTGVIANDSFTAWKRQFPAMPVLVTIIKQFLMMRGLNEVQFGGLGGFSVTCLVTSLLQNMPRVQNREMIPEEHLGEVLIEFLDFYGNRLDTTRTGLLMNPPGYFDKTAYNRPGIRGPVYQANKAQRLAIIDPNNPANDISGGSSEIMLIFDRFSKAHNEILLAMRDPTRSSLLDWSLGGDYESFIRQRNRLLDLYKEKWGQPAGIPDHYRLIQRNSTTTTRLITEIRDFQNTSRQNESAPSPITGARPDAVEDVERSQLQSRRSRANDLRGQYPDMKNIPQEISRQQRKKLIDKYEQQKKALNILDSVTSVEATEVRGIDQASRDADLSAQENQRAARKAVISKKQSERAARLKEEYPEIAGLIPNKIGHGKRKALIDKYSNTAAAEKLTGRTDVPVLASLPPRPTPRARSQDAYSTRPETSLRSMANGFSRNPNAGFQRLNKMVPLRDERRAEIPRNGSGHSPDEPISLD